SRPERSRQDNDAAGAARAAAGRRRPGPAAGRGPVAGRHPAAPAARVRARRRDPVAGPVRRRDHRADGAAARGPADGTASSGPVRAVPARPGQEGPRLFQGQPAEGRAGRGAGLRRGTAAAGRAHGRPGPAHGSGVPRLRPGGTAGRAHDPAVQPHPRRGRSARGPGQHYPRRPVRGDRHAHRTAAPGPHLGHRRPGPPGPPGRRPRRPRPAPERHPGDLPGRQHGADRGARPARRRRDPRHRLPAAHAGRAVPAPLHDRIAGNGGGPVTGLASTGPLTRLALRRDWFMMLAWVLVTTAGVAGVAYWLGQLYPTAAKRDVLASAAGTNPALVFLYSKLYGDSIGALTAWRYGVWAAIFAALMSIFVVIRNTRADEEAGRLELVGSAAVGRHAPLTAALAVAVAGNALLAMLVTAGLVLAGQPAGGSAALALAAAAAGVAFGCVAALAAQMAAGARTARGIALGALGAA